MGSIGWTEIMVIALIAVLLFGAGRIADIGKGLGQGIKNFKEGIKDAADLPEEKSDEAKAEKKSKADEKSA
jgi:sec-independent protein translocase protein TatA